MDIEIKSLSIKKNEKTVFQDFSITFPENKISALIAPSGWGKSTLLNYISEHFPKVSYAFQDQRLLEQTTGLNNILIPLINTGVKKDKNEIIKYIYSEAEYFSIKDRLNEKCMNMSGGEKQRINLMRSFLYPSQILLLDEPFQNLDSANIKNITEYAKKTHRKNPRTTVLVTHSEKETENFCDYVFNFMPQH